MLLVEVFDEFDFFHKKWLSVSMNDSAFLEERVERVPDNHFCLYYLHIVDFV